MPSGRRARAERVGQEIGRVASRYVGGQLVVSSLFGLFAFATLSLAGAPAPLVLACFAAVFDAIPMVGATMATIPAVLFALTVSLPTALIVLALFVIYQQVENNLIVPRVFGAALRISPLAVLIAVLIGGALLGIFGALLALPTAAAIPAIARVRNADDAAASKGAGAPRRTDGR